MSMPSPFHTFAFALKLTFNSMDAFPRWPGLKHIKHVMSVAFTDGEKHFAVQKV